MSGIEFYIAAASSAVQREAERSSDWKTLVATAARAAGCGPCTRACSKRARRSSDVATQNSRLCASRILEEFLMRLLTTLRRHAHRVRALAEREPTEPLVFGLEQRLQCTMCVGRELLRRHARCAERAHAHTRDGSGH